MSNGPKLFLFRLTGERCRHDRPELVTQAGRTWHLNVELAALAPDEHSIVSPTAELSLDARLKLSPATYLVDPCRA